MRPISVFALMVAIPNPVIAQGMPVESADPPASEQSAPPEAPDTRFSTSTPGGGQPIPAAPSPTDSSPLTAPSSQSPTSALAPPPSGGTPPSGESSSDKGSWDSLPPLLGAIAAIITALAALIGVMRRREHDK